VKAGGRHRWRRRVVNFLSRLLTNIGSQIRRQRDANHPAIQVLGTVQAAGKTVFHRPLQAQFPPAPAEAPGNWPCAELYRIERARVSGLCGSIFLPDGKLFSICPWLERLEDRRVRRPLPILRAFVAGPVLCLLGRNHENHGHFLFEYLPRLIAAEKLLVATPGWRVGIAAEHSRWQGRYLGLLGYAAEQIVELRAGTSHIDELLFVPLLSGISSLPDPHHLRSTVERLQAGAQAIAKISDRPKAGHAVIISRSDSPNKRLLNENELVDAARKIFNTVDLLVLTGKTLAQQLEAMATAEVIIGAQGMGLANMAFLRDRILVCLESGEPQPVAQWDLAYCVAAESGGNRALILYGGEPRILPHRHFVYPVDRFADEMRRLKPHLRQSSGP
jgi:hypothetical protein